MAKRKTKHARRERHWAYMDFVRTLPCCLAGPDCSGPIEADHAGERAGFRRAGDTSCIPLCRAHHRARTEYREPFLSMGKAGRREWCDARIAETRAAWDAWEWSEAL